MIKKINFTIEDLEILKKFKGNGNLGTLELAKHVGIAPKNLINRMKKYETLGLISKYNIPAKPKGRKKGIWVNVEVDRLLRIYEHFLNDLDRIASKKENRIQDIVFKEWVD